MSGKQPNAYLAKQAAIRQEYARCGERIGQQLMADCIALVLNEHFGFGYGRIKKMLDALMVEYDKYHDALDGGKEADYVQEKLDQRLQKIVNGQEHFYPFRERYPEIKEITYDKK